MRLKGGGVDTIVKARTGGRGNRRLRKCNHKLIVRSLSCHCLSAIARKGDIDGGTSACTVISCFNGIGCTFSSGCLVSKAMHHSTSSHFNGNGGSTVFPSMSTN